MNINDMSNEDQLVFTTTLIRAKKYGKGDNDGRDIKKDKESMGTGFFYNFYTSKERNGSSVIITNRHIVDQADEITILVQLVDNYGYLIERSEEITFAINAFEILNYPDEQINLCMIYFNIAKSNYVKRHNKNIICRAISNKHCLSTSQLNDLSFIENVIMIGYPNGGYDFANKLPITRAGVTATHASLNYRGQSQFLIDIAAFKGSSGSPVFLYRQERFSEDKKDEKKYKVCLLGIAVESINSPFTGEIEVRNVPNPSSKGTTQIPINLGLVISAKKINDWEKRIQESIGSSSVRIPTFCDLMVTDVH